MKKLTNLLRRELLLSSITVLLLVVVVVLSTTGDSMTNMSSLMLAVSLFVVHAVYLVYVWQESPKDEREELQNLNSNKVSYLAGATVLTVGIGYQLANHDIDVWLPVSLGIMALSKVLSLYRYKNKEK